MNLKELARARGTNLKKVAEQCGVPPSTLYAISSGETNFENVGIGLFMKIAYALDLDTEDLYRMTPEKAKQLKEAALEYSRDHDFYDMADELELRYEADKMRDYIPLASEEKELLDIFRRMDAEGRERLMEQAAFLAERHPLNQGVSVRSA